MTNAVYWDKKKGGITKTHIEGHSRKTICGRKIPDDIHLFDFRLAGHICSKCHEIWYKEH